MTVQDNIQGIKKEIEQALKKSSVSSQTEEQVSNLLTVLEQTGLVNENTKESLKQRLYEDFYLGLITELFSNITPEQEKSIIHGQQTGLNDMQILELQFELYRKNTGKDITEYAETLYTEIAERVLKELETVLRSLSDVEKLSDDQVMILTGMLEAGDEDAVLSKLDTFLANSQGDSTTSIEQPFAYTHIVQLIKDGKLEEAKQEIEQIISTQQQDTTVSQGVSETNPENQITEISPEVVLPTETEQQEQETLEQLNQRLDQIKTQPESPTQDSDIDQADTPNQEQLVGDTVAELPEANQPDQQSQETPPASVTI